MLNAEPYFKDALTRALALLPLVDPRQPPVIRVEQAQTLRAVKLALSILDTPYATSDELYGQIGSKNWVIARRTKRIVDRYGADVICLSSAKYAAAERAAIEARIP